MLPPECPFYEVSFVKPLFAEGLEVWRLHLRSSCWHEKLNPAASECPEFLQGHLLSVLARGPHPMPCSLGEAGGSLGNGPILTTALGLPRGQRTRSTRFS